MKSRESKEQGRSGRSGSQASRSRGTGKQPRQTSRRVEQPSKPSEPKHHFEPGHKPSEQGEQESPSPEMIARHQQGFAGRSGASGSHAATGDRSEEVAQGGGPAGRHTRHGRQKLPGNRSSR